MHDKSAPAVLSAFETPGKFPHNTWLTRDRRHLLAADEIPDGFVSVWDISNLEDIREVSRFRPTSGSGSVPHNAFILNDYAFVSWYRDGLILLDLTRPGNAIQTGRYDSSPSKGKGFNGAWGNYPYLPSGNILASDIEQGLFIFTPAFVRVCYLEGTVKDAGSKQPLSGVRVFILNGNQTEPASTTALGIFKTGQPAPVSPVEDLRVEIYPNPFRDRLIVHCLLPEGNLPIAWQLFDLAGRRISFGQIDSEAAVLELKRDMKSGVYFFHIQGNKGAGKSIKVVKI